MASKWEMKTVAMPIPLTSNPSPARGEGSFKSR